MHTIGTNGGAVLFPESFTADHAAPLGRTAFRSGILWCCLSGSGIAFSFYGTECTLHLTADSACSGGESTAARFAVYVNDIRIIDTQLTQPVLSLCLKNPGSEETPARVRFIKLSEAAFSSVGIREITVSASEAIHRKYQSGLLVPQKPAAHLIEFIGDSITCGYGVDGICEKNPFLTANEDVTKSYAWLTAQELNADYSMICYSGYGIISGYSADGSIVTGQLVPHWYEKTGYSKAFLDAHTQMQDIPWEFAVQPDLIVVNLGTNDASYTGTDPEKQAVFTEAYTAFLKQIRKHNPDAPLICTLGIMDQRLCDAVEQAVAGFRTETGDTRTETMRFDLQSEADGYAVDWHPSALTHRKAADKLTRFISSRYNW